MQFNKVVNSLWVEKYRPATLEDYVGNDNVKDIFARYIEQNDIPHILLAGKAGTGKTTVGKILVNSIDCDYLYINASDENNVETVRTKIKSFVSAVGFKKWKVVFLDEADALTAQSQAALRNMMETFSKNARFIMTCNYPEKIIDPIQSRCTVFDMYPPAKSEVAKRLVQILKLENINFDIKDVATIVNNTYPDIRRSISSLQQQVLNGELKITEQLKIESSYHEKVITALNSKTDVKTKYLTIRQLIADSKVRTFDDLYRYLYDNLEEFTPEGKQAQIILEIANAMRHDPLCVDKEINVMAMFIEILKIIK